MTAAQPRNAVSRMRALHVAIVCAVQSNIPVREIVEWPGGASGRTKPGNSRRANESAARHAIARSASNPSKNPDQQQPEILFARWPRATVAPQDR
jgi:hypothetical protein